RAKGSWHPTATARRSAGVSCRRVAASESLLGAPEAPAAAIRHFLKQFAALAIGGRITRLASSCECLAHRRRGGACSCQTPRPSRWQSGHRNTSAGSSVFTLVRIAGFFVLLTILTYSHLAGTLLRFG